jgi:thermostable 8-oxoguanine DNA glycosylase
LLDIHGVDLAMASTILRFRNPEVFQIIDRHAYRAIYGVKYPLYSMSSNQRKIEAYFEYLDKLLELSQKKGLEFRTLDRLLYEFG